MHVLVVDDDPAIRDLLAMILHDEGYIVASASDGVEALSWMRATNEPVIALLDIWMPRMGGEATLLTALAQPSLRERVSFILMTANPHYISSYAREIIISEQIPLFHKPFEIDHLIALVGICAQRLDQGQGVAVERGRDSSSSLLS